MVFLHKLLARLGVQTDTYKSALFCAEHPAHIVIRTDLHDATGQAHYSFERSRERNTVCAITGETVFFARGKQKLYVALGKTEMDVKIEKALYVHTQARRRRKKYKRGVSVYHVIFDAVSGGAYRFRYHVDKQELELLYENGDDHKLYTFS